MTAPGAYGQIGILPDHAALVTTSSPASCRTSDGGVGGFQIGGGFAEVRDNVVTVLADSGESRAGCGPRRRRRGTRTAAQAATQGLRGTTRRQGRARAGGGRGIGRGIVLAFAREGADVALNYRRDREAAEATAREVEALGRRAVALQADVSDREAVDRMVARRVRRSAASGWA